MSNVNLSIGGRTYTVACGAGEEQHIAMLGREIDARLRALPGMGGQSEPRALLFAALFLADELHEARKGAQSAQGDTEEDPRAAEAMELLASKLEMLAGRLEG